MVRKSVRSGKRKLVKTPGGKYYYKSSPDKPKRAHCATCDRTLPGVPRGSNVEIRRISKTQRRPSRPYGGQLCSPCLRRKLIDAARS